MCEIFRSRVVVFMNDRYSLDFEEAHGRNEIDEIEDARNLCFDTRTGEIQL